jgi:hypothetical protein
MSAQESLFFSIAGAETAELAGMAGMVNKVARATMDRLRQSGPTVAYVLSITDKIFTTIHTNISL